MHVQGNTKETISKGTAAVFKPSDIQDESLRFDVLEDDSRFILLAGKPLNEPIAKYGPFVLNEKAEI